jgi:hypothetical protein
MTADTRRIEQDAKDRDKEMNYYLGLKTSTSRLGGLSTPSARAQHAKEVNELIPTTMAQLEEMIKRSGKEPTADLRTREEVMHDFAVLDAQFKNFK